MMKLNTDEKRSFQFDIRIEGISYRELKGSVKFLIDEIEYGFPVTILEDHITSEILPLDEIVKKGLENGKEVSCVLEIIGDGYYLKPWEGVFTLATPVRVEAKMRADNSPPILKETKVPKEPIKKITATLRDDTNKKPTTLTDSDLMERLRQLLSDQDNKPISASTVPANVPVLKPSPPEDEVIIDPRTRKIVDESEHNRRKIVEKKVIQKLKEMKKAVNPNVVKKLTDRVIKEADALSKKIEVIKVPVKKPKRKITTESRKPTAPNDVHQLMESKGMTNPRTQKSLLETAKKMGGDDEDAIYSTVERLLSVTQPTTAFHEYTRRLAIKESGD